jgi:hypothetical protein
MTKVKRLAYRASILTVILCALIMLAGCSLILNYKDPEETIAYETLYYSFDPQTILDTIDKGQGLRLESWKVYPTPPPSSSLVNWNQDDFYRMAVALIPSDLVGHTYLYLMSFRVDCKDVNSGITAMYFDLSTRLDRQQSQTRSELSIGIQASEGWASISRADKSPGVHTYGTIDLSKMKVTATQALHLAEDLEGRAYRQKVGDRCSIYGTGGGDYWWLMYEEPIQNTPPGLEIRVYQSGGAKIFRQRK